MKTPDDVHDLIVKSWDSSGIASAPVDEQALAALEDESGVKLPASLLALLRQSNGSQGMDGCHLWFLRLEDYRVESWLLAGSETPASASVLVFADFLLSTYVYAIRVGRDLRSEGDVWCSDRAPARRVAASLREFFQLYLDDDPALHHCEA